MSQQYLQQVVNHDLITGSGDPDHVYVDINVINNDPGTVGPVPLAYREIRDRPILNDPSEYYMSIIRFTIPTHACLPVFIPVIQTGQNDPNLSIYSFTFAYQNTYYQYYLRFVPQDKTAAAPKFPIQYQDLSTTYYYITDFQFAVDLLNIALATAFEGFQNALAANEQPVPTNVPFFMYDPQDSSLAINADKNYFDESLDNPCFLYCNTPMKNLLCAFSFEIDSYAGNVNGKNFKMIMRNIQDTNIIEISDSYSAIQMLESYSSTSTWSPVSSIVITTGSMPIISTIQAEPKVFGALTTQTSYNSNINIQVISDFQINMQNGKEYLPSITYSPFQYRLVSMSGNNPLHSIDISCYWRDTYGNFHNFLIGSNSSASFKIMFRKKYLGV
jgi:hypothetical protein